MFSKRKRAKEHQPEAAATCSPSATPTPIPSSRGQSSRRPRHGPVIDHVPHTDTVVDQGYARPLPFPPRPSAERHRLGLGQKLNDRAHTRCAAETSTGWR